jgi:ribonucleoside-diphosphate reductase alpha chain
MSRGVTMIVTNPAVPRVRVGYTAEFRLGGQPATLTATALPDGRLGEVALRAGKHGSTLAGMTDALSTAVSVALAHGTPLGALTQEMRGMRFAPAGHTDDAEIGPASSLADYVARRHGRLAVTAVHRAR